MTILETAVYPLIDGRFMPFDVPRDDFNEAGLLEAVARRAYFENRLAHNPAHVPTRFAILNYYYLLAHFDAYIPEAFVCDNRSQFRQNLGFFVRLRPIEGFAAADEPTDDNRSRNPNRVRGAF